MPAADDDADTGAVTVAPGAPRDAASAALLRASHEMMTSLFPVESNHFLSLDALEGPDIRFFTATHRCRTVGCGALAIRDGYGEIKSMFVAPEARGTGVAAALLDRIEAEARAERLAVLRLETGDRLDAALRLYERRGFAVRGPFGDYREDPHSVFMEKRMT